MTAEGIRPALYFGGECGRIVQQVLDGALPLEVALERYRRLVARYRGPYRVLQFAAGDGRAHSDPLVRDGDPARGDVAVPVALVAALRVVRAT